MIIDVALRRRLTPDRLFLDPPMRRRPPKAFLAATLNFVKGTYRTSWLAPMRWYPGKPATRIDTRPLMMRTLVRPTLVDRLVLRLLTERPPRLTRLLTRLFPPTVRLLLAGIFVGLPVLALTKRALS
jgi:hypothetical protein